MSSLSIDGDSDGSDPGIDMGEDIYKGDKGLAAIQSQADDLQRMTEKLAVQKEQRIKSLKKAEDNIRRKQIKVDYNSDDNLLNPDSESDDDDLAYSVTESKGGSSYKQSTPKRGRSRGRGRGAVSRPTKSPGKSPKPSGPGSRGSNWSEPEKECLYLSAREFRFDLLEFGDTTKEKREARKAHAYSEIAIAIGVSTGTYRSPEQVKNKLMYHRLDVKKLGETEKFNTLTRSQKLGYEFWNWNFTKKYPGHVDDLINEACQNLGYSTSSHTYKLLQACREKERAEINNYRADKKAHKSQKMLANKGHTPGKDEDEDFAVPYKRPRVVENKGMLGEEAHSSSTSQSTGSKTVKSLFKPKIDDSIIILDEELPSPRFDNELQKDLRAAKIQSLMEVTKNESLMEKEQQDVLKAMRNSLKENVPPNKDDSSEDEKPEPVYERTKGKSGGKGGMAKNRTSPDKTLDAFSRMQQVLLVKIDGINDKVSQLSERMAKVEVSLLSFQQKVSKTTVCVQFNPTMKGTVAQSHLEEQASDEDGPAHFSGIGKDLEQEIQPEPDQDTQGETKDEPEVGDAFSKNDGGFIREEGADNEDDISQASTSSRRSERTRKPKTKASMGMEADQSSAKVKPTQQISSEMKCLGVTYQ